MNEIKICSNCKRELPANTDYFFMKLGKLNNRCKECCGRKFTNHLTHIPKEGYMFCKKCDRELPYTFQYFPEDKGTTTGLRNVCRECNPSYGKFLEDGKEPQRGWTNEELTLLNENYSNYTNEELHSLFLPNRSVRAIESQAFLMGCNFKSDEAIKKGRKSQAQKTSIKLKGRIATEEQKQKQSKAMKEYYQNNVPFWTGRKRSAEQCAQISERQKGKWSGDKNPRHLNPLNGSANGRWKGGILNTYTELRSDTKDWQNVSMEFCNYHCVITGGGFDNIHHTTPFRKIVDEVFGNTNIDIKEKVQDYSIEDFNKLRSELKILHNNYGFGACLQFDVHKLFHDNYGYINFTPYDFLDFVYRIDCGEFDKWFNEHNLGIDINYDYIEYLESTLLLIKSA